MLHGSAYPLMFTSTTTMMLSFLFVTTLMKLTSSTNSRKTVDMIIDADFGGPIDDTFALAYALKKQSLDDTFNIRLISMVGRNVTARATILSKFLSLTGYAKMVDIGIGEAGPCGFFHSIKCVGPAWKWMDQFPDYTLDDYQGTVYEDGIGRFTEIIEEYSPTNPIYVVTVGALTNLATIISTKPKLKKNIRLFTMSGSLFDEEHNLPGGVEFNILDDIPAAQVVYNERQIAPYYSNICAVPWDTGYYFQIAGDQYKRLLDAKDDNLMVKYMLEMNEIWYANGGYDFDEGRTFHPNNASASLYDLEMVWMAAYIAGLDMEECDKSCETVPYLVMDGFNVEVSDTGHEYPTDEPMSCVYFAKDWEEPNGLNDIVKEIVDVILTPDIDGAGGSGSGSKEKGGDDEKGHSDDQDDE